jgi:hypothetical protein
VTSMSLPSASITARVEIHGLLGHLTPGDEFGAKNGGHFTHYRRCTFPDSAVLETRFGLRSTVELKPPGLLATSRLLGTNRFGGLTADFTLSDCCVRIGRSISDGQQLASRHLGTRFYPREFVSTDD